MLTKHYCIKCANIHKHFNVSCCFQLNALIFVKNILAYIAVTNLNHSKYNLLH